MRRRATRPSVSELRELVDLHLRLLLTDASCQRRAALMAKAEAWEAEQARREDPMAPILARLNGNAELGVSVSLGAVIDERMDARVFIIERRRAHHQVSPAQRLRVAECTVSRAVLMDPEFDWEDEIYDQLERQARRLLKEEGEASS